MTDTDGIVRSFYDRWARVYDRVADLPPVAGWRDRTAASLGLEPGDTVVEMGCGTGANLPYLRERVGRHGEVVGLDLTRGMLERARERGRAPATLVQGDATRPPLGGDGDGSSVSGDDGGGADADGADGDGADVDGADADGSNASGSAVDAVLGTFVVGLFDDPGPVIEQWCDLVGPGGRVGLLHFHESDRPWAGPPNAVYRGLVRVSAPGGRRAAGAAADHDRRVRYAHHVLAERSESVVRREFAGGFLRLAVGRLPRE